MPSEFWDRLKPIFHAACEMDASERVAYLEKACGDDVDLREEVNRLLAQHDASGAFVDCSPPQLGWSGTRSPSPRAVRPGERLADRFQITRFVGSGGMGEVYEAEDLDFRERVALKTLRPELVSDEPSLARFKREVQLARRVSHKNVCRIFDGGRHRTGEREITFLTMEYLEGGTLSAHLKNSGALPTEKALPLIRQIAEGLAALHDAGIVHRDVKPGNVMLVPADGETPRAVITDFGLARPAIASRGPDGALTESGQMLGTLDYMAPEQLVGEEVGPQSDVYSFATVVYEMLCGRRPFSSDSTAKVMVQKLTEVPTPPSEHAPGLDPRWDVLLLGCLEREAEKRISSPQEVLRWLDELAQGRPGPGAATGPARRVLPKEPRKSAPPVPQHSPRRLVWAAAATATGLVFASLQLSPLRRPVLRMLCNQFPGSSWFCVLPADKDVAVVPFQVLASSEDDRALGIGLSRFVSETLRDLNPERSLTCVHSGEDAGNYGVSLELGGRIELDSERIHLLMNLRAADPAQPSTQGRVLRTSQSSFRRALPETLDVSLLSELTRILEWEASGPIWNRQLRNWPKHKEAFAAFLTGVGYLESDKPELAAEHFDRSISEDFSYAPAHSSLGDAYRREWELTGDYKWQPRARNAYIRALGLRDDLAATHLGLGALEDGLGHVQEAATEYAKALEIDPYSFAAHTRLAAAHEAAGRADLAEDVARRAIEGQSECWRVRNHYADFYMRHARYVESERELLNVIRLAPRMPGMYSNLAYVYIKLGRYDDAVEMAARAAALDPSALRFANLGTAYLFRGCVDDALVNLSHATELDENSFDAWGGLARALDRIPGRQGDAESAFERVVLLAGAVSGDSPRGLGARRWLALSLARLGRSTEALEQIEELLRHAPRSGDSLFLASVVYEMAGLRQKALELLGLALGEGVSVFETQVNHWLDNLRSDVRYERILSELNIDPTEDPGETTTKGRAVACPSWAVPGRGFRPE